ncbi:MAG: SDR family NAD(P)-dependent oxidoreductase [Pseudomonadota bacterium]
MTGVQGQRAFITGGSSGIGLSMARQLVQAGAHVAIAARGAQRLGGALEELKALAAGGQIVAAFPLDVADRAAVLAVAAQAIEALGGLDLLINNAGITRPGHFAELDDGVFEDMVVVNYLGMVWTTRAFLPALLASGRGRVLNVSSIAGLLGVFGYTAYGASKFAVTGFTEALRQELKPKGITVSLLCPPDTDTPQLAGEEPFKPAETRAMAGKVRPLPAEVVARAGLEGALAGTPVIVPGFDGWVTATAARLLPGVARWVMDRDVASVAKR